MPRRRNTPEEQEAARQRKNEANRRRRSQPGYRASKQKKQNEIRRNWRPERRIRANAAARRSRDRRNAAQRAHSTKYMREYTLQRKYGISQVQWEARFEQQDRVCACCGRSDPGSIIGWSTDHSHKPPYQIRGILCHKCNLRIGQLGDNYDDVAANCERYLKYLARTEGLRVPSPASSTGSSAKTGRSTMASHVTSTTGLSPGNRPP